MSQNPMSLWTPLLGTGAKQSVITYVVLWSVPSVMVTLEVSEGPMCCMPLILQSQCCTGREPSLWVFSVEIRDKIIYTNNVEHNQNFTCSVFIEWETVPYKTNQSDFLLLVLSRLFFKSVSLFLFSKLFSIKFILNFTDLISSWLWSETLYYYFF